MPPDSSKNRSNTTVSRVGRGAEGRLAGAQVLPRFETRRPHRGPTASSNHSSAVGGSLPRRCSTSLRRSETAADSSIVRPGRFPQPKRDRRWLAVGVLKRAPCRAPHAGFDRTCCPAGIYRPAGFPRRSLRSPSRPRWIPARASRDNRHWSGMAPPEVMAVSRAPLRGRSILLMAS